MREYGTEGTLHPRRLLPPLSVRLPQRPGELSRRAQGAVVERIQPRRLAGTAELEGVVQIDESLPVQVLQQAVGSPASGKPFELPLNSRPQNPHRLQIAGNLPIPFHEQDIDQRVIHKKRPAHNARRTDPAVAV